MTDSEDPDAADAPDAPGERPIAPPDDVPPVSAEELVDGEVPGPGAEGERRYPSTIGGAFYLLLLAVVGVGLVIVTTGEWRLGVRVMGGALILGAVVRLLLRARDAGMLAVRHKLLDAFVLASLGGLLIFLAGSIPGQAPF